MSRWVVFLLGVSIGCAGMWSFDRVGSGKEVSKVTAPATKPTVSKPQRAENTVAPANSDFENRLLAAAADPTIQFAFQKELLEQGKEVLPQLATALGKPDPLLRKQACWGIGLLGTRGLKDEALLPQLRLCLSDKETDVRLQATKAVGLQGSKDALLSLKPSLSDPDPQVRLYAARYLGAIDRSAIPVLIALTKDGQHASLATSYLQELTGQPFSSASQWEAWWKQQPEISSRSPR